MKKFTADFETATWKKDETWVWAWAISEISENENFQYGTNIDEFMEFCKKQKNSYFYFHNLKFDGEFIIWWLLNNGYKWVETKKEVETNTFTTLISDLGQFYNIEVYFYKKGKNVKKASFFDSLKIIPFSVSEVAKSFHLKEQKLQIDYKKEREKGHKLTEEEVAYIKNDVVIMSKALKHIFDVGLTRMTSARKCTF